MRLGSDTNNTWCHDMLICNCSTTWQPASLFPFTLLHCNKDSSGTKFKWYKTTIVIISYPLWPTSYPSYSSLPFDWYTTWYDQSALPDLSHHNICCRYLIDVNACWTLVRYVFYDMHYFSLIEQQYTMKYHRPVVIIFLVLSTGYCVIYLHKQFCHRLLRSHDTWCNWGVLQASVVIYIVYY